MEEVEDRERFARRLRVALKRIGKHMSEDCGLDYTALCKEVDGWIHDPRLEVEELEIFSDSLKSLSFEFAEHALFADHVHAVLERLYQDVGRYRELADIRNEKANTLTQEVRA